MPDYRAGYVIEHVPVNDEIHRTLRDWAKAHDRTVPQILASLARDAAHAIAKQGGTSAPDNLDAVTVPEPPKPGSRATHPEHIALLELLDALDIPHPVLPNGWHRRRLADMTPQVRALFDLGWNDERIAAALHFTPSGLLEERRRMGLFRQQPIGPDRARMAREMWEIDGRRVAFEEIGIEFPPLRPGADRLTCRDFRPAIGILVMERKMTDSDIGSLIGYGAAAVSIERRALNLPGQLKSSQRGAVHAKAS